MRDERRKSEVRFLDSPFIVEELYSLSYDS